MMNALFTGFVGLVLSAPVVAEPLLEGIVRFASGEPAAAVRVRVFDMSDLQRGAVAQATTNSAGYFALPLSALSGRALPEGFTLGPNYPNPFNPSTIIPYQLAASSAVRLEVFNLLGQRVATLVEGERPAGFHTATWHATDAAGRAVGAGVYIYRLAVGAASQTGRMVLLDGQAGVSAVRAGSVLPEPASGEASVYGLIVEGPGLVPYMDPSFRVAAGMAPVELVVSAGSSWSVTAAKACGLCGFLGDAATDSTALVALYEATDGDNWTNNTNWLSDRPLGEWHRVTTDADGRVIRLALYDYQLNGTIPPELGSLTNLQYLGLGNNQLSGPIPPELGNLANLQGLDLRNNQLSGPIPPELGNLTNLTHLYLFGNQLSGPIPAELGNLTNLQDLYLNGNQLSGCVPEGLRNVEDNDFSGLGLPSCGADEGDETTDEGDETTDKAALVALYNATNGDNWTDNTHWLSDRPLGEWHGVTTDADGRVTRLNLKENELSGAIPPQLGNLTNLQFLNLYRNQLSGAIPAELGNLTNLQVLALHFNQLSGAIPAELGNLTNLTALWLSGNQLSGAIPAELGNLTNLTALWLSGNQLSGAIPAELGNLTNLTALHLSSNQLSGCVPEGLRNVGHNDFYDLGLSVCVADGADEVAIATDRAALVALYNATDGDNWTNNTNWLSDRPLSEWYGVTTDADGRVMELDLNSNRLEGEIPTELGNLTNLIELNLSGNGLSGPIPPELGNLTNLTVLSFNGNGLSGPIPPELGNLSNLTGLFLSFNQLSGTIPTELGNLANLQYLFLSRNQLSGCVPEGLRNVGNIDFSDLGLPFCDGRPYSDAATDRAVLVALYNATDGDNWTNNHNWLSDRPLGAWHGVTTDANGRVTALFLFYNQLNGPIPSELGNLNNLTELHLHYNQLSGPIPPELENLTNLTVLFLSFNQLSGCVPEGLRNVENNNLSDLGLPFCDDPGFVPDKAALVALYEATDGDNWTNNTHWLSDRPLGEWHGVTTNTYGRVTALNLSANQLSGQIPPELGNLYNLEDLYLGGNQLSGCVPSGLRNVLGNDLADLGLSFCFLAGDGAALAALYEATDGDNWTNNTNWLSDQPLGEWHGVITDADGRVKSLNLSANQLSGQISPELGSLTNLRGLSLSFNQLSGQIPPELGSLTNLRGLSLSFNQLSGQVPPELENLTNLSSLDLSFNQLSGQIPSELGNLTNLYSLDLSVNQLSGAIPAELGSLSNLRTLWLGLNNLTDISVLRGLINLISLDLRGNPISISSINASFPDLRSDAIAYLDPPLRESDFDIELVFRDDHFTEPQKLTEPQKRVIRYAARRWMSIIREDLPDYTFSQAWAFGGGGDQPDVIPSGERIDDLRIYVSVRTLPEVSAHIGGVEQTFKPAAMASPFILRETHLPVVGFMGFDVSWVTFDPVSAFINIDSAPIPLLSIALHEIGHVLGIIGGVWDKAGFLQDSSDDPHFNGPLAIAAFDDAGGRDYTGAKVPVESGSHWRTPVLTNELMSSRGYSPRLSAITVQALADLGYVVDVTQADPYTLPDAAAAKVAAFHPQAEPQPMCGVGTERKPIYVVDPQGRIIRTLSH